MHHAFIDHLAQRDGPGRRLDPRVKTLLALAAVLAVVTSDEPWRLAALFALLACAALAARLPVLHLVRRVAVVLPFALLVAVMVPITRPGEVVWEGPLSVHVTREGLVDAGLLVSRAFVAAFAVLLLVSTTPFSRLVAGLERLGLPRLLVLLLSFLYRYLFVLVDEAMRMRRSAIARGFGRPVPGRLAAAGAVLGTLFMRTYDRSERIYVAMQARGFSGEVALISPLRLRAQDAVAGFVGAAVLCTVSLWGRL